MKCAVAAASPVITFSLLLAGVTWGVPHRNVHEQIYVCQAKGQETSSIILGPSGKLLYGNGGRYGTRHKYVAGFYEIKGKTIVLYEYNGHKYLTEGHQNYLPFTPKSIDMGLGRVYRRLR